MEKKRTRSEHLALLLMQLANRVAEMSDAELSDFLSSAGTPDRISKEKRPSKPDYTSLVAELRGAHELGQGAALLRRAAPTKTDLVNLARHLDLPVSKRDTVEQLSDRIVDTTIGYRLRSAAIRGNKAD